MVLPSELIAILPGAISEIAKIAIETAISVRTRKKMRRSSNFAITVPFSPHPPRPLPHAGRGGENSPSPGVGEGVGDGGKLGFLIRIEPDIAPQLVVGRVGFDILDHRAVDIPDGLPPGDRDRAALHLNALQVLHDRL